MWNVKPRLSPDTDIKAFDNFVLSWIYFFFILGYLHTVPSRPCLLDFNLSEIKGLRCWLILMQYNMRHTEWVFERAEEWKALSVSEWECVSAESSTFPWCQRVRGAGHDCCGSCCLFHTRTPLHQRRSMKRHSVCVWERRGEERECVWERHSHCGCMAAFPQDYVHLLHHWVPKH